MALATRCPHCNTTFRVAHDQLKLRSGLVRCGSCKEIFNGVEHLLRPEDKQPAPGTHTLDRPPTQSPALGLVQPVANSNAVEDTSKTTANTANTQIEPASEVKGDDQEVNTKDSSKESQSEPAPSSAKPDSITNNSQPASNVENPVNEEDPLQRMTLMDFAAFAHPADSDAAAEATDAETIDNHNPRHKQNSDVGPESNDELSKAIDSLQGKPWRRKKHIGLSTSVEETDFSERTEATEPSFVKRARRQKHYGRVVYIATAIGTVILFIILLAQALYAFRPLIAAHVPATRPLLGVLCDVMHCRIGLPSQIDRISIESSDLKASPTVPDRLTLVALLRNHADTTQAWPKIELTLTDADHKPVVRKIFAPRDYLPANQDGAKGFPAQSEQAVKLSFDLLQVKASDYRLYLFYP